MYVHCLKTIYNHALKKQNIPRFFESVSQRRFIATMARFTWRLLYTGTIFLRFLLVTASPQFETTSTSGLGDSAIQYAATSLNPDPDAVPDAQWTSKPQDPDLIAQPQSPDDNAFIPPLISYSSPDTQIPDANSQLLSGSCSTKDNLKAGASRLLRRVNGEIQPCCDPVNLGLEGPLGWIFGRNTIEERSPYCCEGGGVEYARTRICVPCMLSSYAPPR